MNCARAILHTLLLAASLAAAVTLTVMMNWEWTVFYILAAAVMVLWLGVRRKRGCAYALAVFILAVGGFYALLTPEQQFRGSRWETSCARKPQVRKLDGRRFEFRDVRDFRYRTEHDFDVRYRNEIYDVDKLESLDLALSHWDGMDNIAHMMLCFNFSDGKSAALSVEMQCPQGTSRDYYTTLFKQHGLIYIWAPPEDLFDLRSNYRTGEALYRYRTTATQAEVKQLFVLLAERTADLYGHLEFYRTVRSNCTTELLPYLKAVRPDLQWDYRVLLNGTIDRMFFEQGFLRHKPGESFESLRAGSIVRNRP